MISPLRRVACARSLHQGAVDMNQLVRPKSRFACPHDCPSTCALSRIIDGAPSAGPRSRGECYTARDCPRCALRRAVHHHRLKSSACARRPKGLRRICSIFMDDDSLGRPSIRPRRTKHGSEAVWPYYLAGTMGFCSATASTGGHAKNYSVSLYHLRQSGVDWFIAGTGNSPAADPADGESTCDDLGHQSVNTKSM